MRTSHFLAAISVALVAMRIACGQESDWQHQFQKSLAAAQAAEERQDWAAAVPLYEDVQKLIPGEITTLASLSKCLLHLNRTDEALDRLSQAVRNGWNQRRVLETDPVFGPVREAARFKALLVLMGAIEKENIVVYVPPGLDRAKPAPLIVAFHGRGENPHMFVPTWKAAANELKAVVVATRGPKAAGEGLLHLWDGPDAAKEHDTSRIDLAACVTLAGEAINKAKQAANIDLDRVVLAGYSQGGAVALQVFREQPDCYAGVWAHAALYRAADASYWEGCFSPARVAGTPSGVHDPESSARDSTTSATPERPTTAPSTSGRQREASGPALGPVSSGEPVHRPALNPRPKPFYLLVGELDKLRPQSESACKHLVTAGANVKLEIAPGAGHEPPPDYTRRQIEGIRFILGSR